MSKPTILLTGATGFTGRHLLAHLRRRGAEPLAISRQPQAGLATCDLGDAGAVRRLLERTRPDHLYHCAGTFANDWATDLPANVTSTGNLLAAIADLGLPTRILLIGSAAEYGHAPAGPIPETTPLRPVSVYGLTKVLQTQLMEFAHRQRGVAVVMARTFNLLGDGISTRLFPGRVAEQIDAFKAGKTDRIRLGNLESRRDYLPVTQAVAEYERILIHGAAGEAYHVASGVPLRMRDLLERMLKAHGLGLDLVESTPLRPASADPGEVYADISKLNSLPPA